MSDPDVFHPTMLLARRCPDCGASGLRWRKVKGARPHPGAIAKCPLCPWVGPFWGTIPVCKALESDSSLDVYGRVTRVLNDGFDRMLQAERAVADFETRLQNHPNGDVDSSGSAFMRKQLRKSVEVAISAQLATIMGVSPDQASVIADRLIDLRWPSFERAAKLVQARQAKPV